MLYESLSQPLVFVCLVGAGVGAGFLFDFGNLLHLLSNKNKIFQQIIYFINTLLSAGLLFIVNLNANYGRFRIFVVFSFLIAFIIERFTLGKLWTKLLNRCYNSIKEFKIVLIKKFGYGKRKTK